MRGVFLLYLVAFASAAAAQPSAAPSDLAALEFVWQDAEAANEIVGPDGEIARICRVQPRGIARFGRYHVMNVAGGWFEADGVGPDIARGCQASGRFSLEVTITPRTSRTTKPAAIVSFHAQGEIPNFTLVQCGDRLVASLATSMGVLPCVIGELAAGRSMHVAVVYAPGRLSAYLDGASAAVVDVEEADLSTWKAQELVFGAEDPESNGWAGTIEAVTIQSCEVDASEAARRHEAHLARVRDRTPANRLVVKAKLVETSQTPSVAEISPYRRALAGYTYEVQKIIDGACDSPRLQVAHWVILDRNILPLERVIGTSYELALERFEDHEELDAERLASDSEEFDLPLFYDVSQ